MLKVKYDTEVLTSNCDANTIESLEEDKENLLTINSQLADKYNTELLNGINKSFNYIEPLRLYDKQAYIIAYTNIIEDLEDPPESPQDVMSEEEYDMFCRIVEAEIGNGNFEQKINVSTCIINRYLSTDKSWYEIFTEDNQFSTVSNGKINTVDVTESTKLSLEYAWLFKNEDIKDATYFKSGDDSNGWHENNLTYVFYDGKHTFYKE